MNYFDVDGVVVDSYDENTNDDNDSLMVMIIRV